MESVPFILSKVKVELVSTIHTIVIQWSNWDQLVYINYYTTYTYKLVPKGML